MQSVQSTQPHRRTTRPLVPLLLISLTTLLPACSDDLSEAEVERGGELQSGSGSEATDSIPAPEVDSIVGRYFAATDSLASLFNTITTVAEVEANAAEIVRLNEEIWEFNRLSVQYGQVLLDRMAEIDRGESLERLLDARTRLQEMPEVYAAVEEVEADVSGRAVAPAAEDDETGGGN